MNNQPGLIASVHPRVAVVLHDMGMVWVAWTLSYYLRYSVMLEAPEIMLFSTELVLVLLVQSAVFLWSGLYKGVWRFASVQDMSNLLKSSVVGVLLATTVLVLFSRFDGVPRSVLAIYPVLLFILLGAPRLAYRLWKDSRDAWQSEHPQERVLVLGAGQSGNALVREFRRDNRYRVVGFLDDDRRLAGAKIQGYPVLGSIQDLAQIAPQVAADLAIIAIPSSSDEDMQRVVDICERARVRFRTLPPLHLLISGKAEIGAIKRVSIDDLLGRQPVTLDWRAIGKHLGASSVLVTGGGGSIGTELCRQIAGLAPARLIVLDNSEHNLYQIERELSASFPTLLLHAVLGDVCDEAVCKRLFSDFSPQVVFHAAAYKHVPLLEGQVREAVRNNVFGTLAVAKAALHYGCGCFVLISTDKAVNPTNVMGASKRIAEIYCQGLAASNATRFITVRFGNVLNSAGSVVPLFQEQIDRGGPVTVTHPEITRYFMTIPEACQLIMQSAVIGKGGEIFVLDMGEPVRIMFLAEQMIRLAGKQPGEDIKIVCSGLRPGEKLFEELFHEQESRVRTEHQKIFLARARGVDSARLTKLLDSMQRAVASYDEAILLQQVRELVPEFGNNGAPVSDVIELNKARIAARKK